MEEIKTEQKQEVTAMAKLINNQFDVDMTMLQALKLANLIYNGGFSSQSTDQQKQDRPVHRVKDHKRPITVATWALNISTALLRLEWLQKYHRLSDEQEKAIDLACEALSKALTVTN